MANYLIHYGMPRRSGRYPYGSGERPFQSAGGGGVNKKKVRNVNNKIKNKKETKDNKKELQINDKQKNIIENKKEEIKEVDTKGLKLTDGQKKALKLGATIAASILVSYGGYKISSSPKFRNLIYKGMNATVFKNNKPDFDAGPDIKIVDKFGNEVTGEALQRLIDKGLI